MDFLNRGFAQLSDLFRTLSPGARLTAALLLIVTVVSLAYLFNTQVSGGDVYLLGGQIFSPGQLAAMEAALGDANLEASIDGPRIKIPRGQQSKYMAALAKANALPAEFGDRLQKAASANPFFTSRSQQEALVKTALQLSLQDIINEMGGVERSSVNIAEETTAGLLPKKLVKASVGLQLKGSQPPDRALVEGVRTLLAGAVAGLNPEAVSVIDLRTSRTFAGTGGGNSKGGKAGEYADHKQRYEQEWQEKVKDLLSYIPGVLVQAHVELNPEISNVKTATEFDNKAVVFENKETTNNRLVEGAAPGGRPGLPAQGGVANAAATLAGATGPRNNDEMSQIEQRKAVPSTTQQIVREGLTPERVSISVNIPKAYYEEIWRQRNPTPEGQPEKKPEPQQLADLQTTEKKSIEEAIVTILPRRDKTVDPFPQVFVMTYDTIASAPLPEPKVQDAALAWLGQNWSTLGLAGLAMVSLLMLRSMVRSISSTAPAAAPASSSFDTVSESPMAMSAAAYEAPNEPIDNTARSRLKRRTASGPSLKEELAGIVQEDPEAAVSILKTWIGSAA